MDVNKLKYAIADNNEDIVTAQLDYARTKLSNYKTYIQCEVNKNDEYGLTVLDYIAKSNNKNISYILNYFVPTIPIMNSKNANAGNVNDFMYDINRICDGLISLFVNMFCSEKINEKYNGKYVELLMYFSSVVSMLVAFIFSLTFLYHHILNSSFYGRYGIVLIVLYSICFSSQMMVWYSMISILYKDPGYIISDYSMNIKTRNDTNDSNDHSSADQYPSSYDIAIQRIVHEYLQPILNNQQIKQQQQLQHHHQQQRDENSDQTNSLISHTSYMTASSSSQDFTCHQCRVLRPFRSGHSYFSNQCVLRYDHFCAFLNADIGEKNYYLFIFIIAVMATMAMPSFFVLAIIFIGDHIGLIRAPDSDKTVWIWIYFKIMDIYFIWSVLMWVVIVCILVFHCWLMARGLTSREFRLIHNNGTNLSNLHRDSNSRKNYNSNNSTSDSNSKNNSNSSNNLNSNCNISKNHSNISNSSNSSNNKNNSKNNSNSSNIKNNSGDSSNSSNIKNNSSNSSISHDHDHDITPALGRPTGRPAKRTRRPIYVTETGKNLFSYDSILTNIKYMLFSTYQPLSTEEALVYEQKDVKVGEMYDKHGRERHCYCLRDVAKLQLARKRHLK